ncbi:ATP-dependent Clp protease ATP-binding subunit [Weissella kandleri]|uniref:ATP-dependent Clp protease ATP-binding subunit n=1 Tax=Weissella kandleri TaxID=1616 RepID=UPI00387EA401
MSQQYTDKLQAALAQAQLWARHFRHQVVGTEDLMLGMMTTDEKNAGQEILLNFHVTDRDIQEEIEDLTGYGMASRSNHAERGYSPKALVVMQKAEAKAAELKATEVGTEHLLFALLDDENILSARIISELGLTPADVKQATLQMMGAPLPDNNKKENLFGPKRQKREPGETPTLDSLARDLTAQARDDLMDPVIGREAEVKRVTQILARRTKNNPVLVGEPGVGKTAIAEGLAQLIVAGEVPESLAHKRLMMLEMGRLVAGTKFRGEFEDRVKNILEEVHENGQVILFIDELHTLIGAGGAEGAIDASNLLKPALARGEVQVIGATTLDEYQKYIETDAALARRFAKVQIDEPSEADAIEILRGLKPRYEEHHQVQISDKAVVAAVKLAVRYMPDRFLPDKAIDLLDEAAAKVQIENHVAATPISALEEKIENFKNEKEAALESFDFELAAQMRKKELAQKKKLEKQRNEQAAHHYTAVLKEEDLAEVLSEQTGIPVQQMTQNEKERLLNLESELHKRVIGQDEAVSAIARAIRRARSGLTNPNRPMGTFMFLGPTGVGKTELAKALAATVFGSEDNMIRVDMSEFMESYSTSRLVGAAPGYVGFEEGGQLTEKVRRHPYSVILLDEAEKAHPDVYNLMLQVFDDGYLTDAKGRKIDFRNTIIIMTSNLGATRLRDEKTVGFGANNDVNNYERMNQMVRQTLKETFKPEFINRLDEAVVFKALDKSEVKAIVRLLANQLVARMAEQNYQIKITPAAVALIADEGFDPEYGARPLRRALQTKVEDEISEQVLAGKIKPNQLVTIGAHKGEITFKN